MDNIELKLKHVIQVILKNIQDVAKNLEHVKENKELDESTKNSITNFSGYHLLVLSIVLDQLSDEAKEWYPEAIGLIDWAKKNYIHGVENKSITPCSCEHCLAELTKNDHPIENFDAGNNKTIEFSA